MLVYLQHLAQRVGRLESSQPVRNAVVDTTEELVPKFLEVERQYKVLGAHLDNWAMKMAHIRHGGDPEAPWKDVVQWHNDKYPSKK
jgi:hypothetical protein